MLSELREGVLRYKLFAEMLALHHGIASSMMLSEGGGRVLRYKLFAEMLALHHGIEPTSQ